MSLPFRTPALRAIARRLPPLEGAPIRVRFLPELTALQDGVESCTGRGQQVHAACFLRRREIVLDASLRENQKELARIAVHELYHFAWMRLGNSRRRDFARLLEKEMTEGARGELGWSAETAKLRLSPLDRRRTTRLWREYACESFCDTAAWLLAGVRRHEEFTLADRFRRRRRAWFRDALPGVVLI